MYFEVFQFHNLLTVGKLFIFRYFPSPNISLDFGAKRIDSGRANFPWWNNSPFFLPSRCCNR